MDNSNPLIRLSIFGRLKKMVGSYRGEELTVTDRRILRGLYKRNLRDFDDELNDYAKNTSLFKRIKDSFVGGDEPNFQSLP